MPSIDEAVADLIAADRPILFLDTCILLDIIRSTHRCLPNYAERALELSRLASASSPACAIIVSSIVPKEWEDNARTVIEETIRHLRRMEEQSGHFHDACQALGIAVATPRTRYGETGLAEALRDLSRSIIDQAIRLDEDADSRLRAFARVVNKTPPALRGKPQDSAIIEEYLAVCRKLQAAGFARRRVFCTSNTEDFCEPGGEPHLKLAEEFAACSLNFTKTLPWALHLVTH